jgi:hypothetical protein
VLREHVVQDREEARVALEGLGRRRHGGGAADCERRVRRGGVEVGEEVGVRSFGVGEDFLEMASVSTFGIELLQGPGWD